MPQLSESDCEYITSSQITSLLTRWSYRNIWIGQQRLLPYFLRTQKSQTLIQIIIRFCPKKHLDRLDEENDCDNLTLAMQSKNESIIRMLLDADIYVRTYDEFVSGHSALVSAYCYGNQRLVFLILSKLHQQRLHVHRCIKNLQRLDYNDMDLDQIYENSKSNNLIRVLNRVFYEPLKFMDKIPCSDKWQETILLETEFVTKHGSLIFWQISCDEEKYIGPWHLKFGKFEPTNKFVMSTRYHTKEIHWYAEDETSLQKKLQRDCSIVYGPVSQDLPAIKMVMSTTVFRNIQHIK